MAWTRTQSPPTGTPFSDSLPGGASTRTHGFMDVLSAVGPGTIS